jgi:hypothetical protein
LQVLVPSPSGTIFENVLHHSKIDRIKESISTLREKNFFLIYKEIQVGAVEKSCMRKGFLIYEECANK